MKHNIFSLLIADGIVSHETIERINSYIALLSKWNKAINLISKQEPDLATHISDAILGSTLITDKSSVIFDFGSGNGIPGMIFALLGFENVFLIERDIRKSVFLQEARRILDLKCTVINSDFGLLSDSGLPIPDLVISKAVGNTKFLIDVLAKQYTTMPSMLLFKSKSQIIEIKKIQNDWSFELQVVGNKYITNKVHLLINNIQKLNGC